MTDLEQANLEAIGCVLNLVCSWKITYPNENLASQEAGSLEHILFEGWRKSKEGQKSKEVFLNLKTENIEFETFSLSAVHSVPL